MNYSPIFAHSPFRLSFMKERKLLQNWEISFSIICIFIKISREFKLLLSLDCFLGSLYKIQSECCHQEIDWMKNIKHIKHRVSSYFWCHLVMQGEQIRSLVPEAMNNLIPLIHSHPVGSIYWRASFLPVTMLLLKRQHSHTSFCWA